ncbi:type II pantothenate kinase [Heyndrickxia sp. MSNUG]|uniref:type II pantothenate kinase n=1 Tax=Heyndrickxia sp. MSNUG TaxID=3136677 RepID=UPI003C2D11AB
MNENTIGIDAGGSLIKIAFEEKSRIHFKKYSIEDLESAFNWLKMFAASKRIVLTGGKAGSIKADFFQEAEIVNEFKAACEGAMYLMEQEKISLQEKVLLVNIGTGTSWFVMEGSHYERVLGSGIGGGTFMGLGTLLGDSRDFSELVELASIGTRGKVDLLVKDIYHPEEPPIPGDLTASNFAKASKSKESSAADQVAAVINMISETITLLSVQAATLHSTKKVIYIGSTLSGNKVLQSYLEKYAKMSGLESVFLQNGEYSGALGAKRI